MCHSLWDDICIRSRLKIVFVIPATLQRKVVATADQHTYQAVY